VKKAIEYTLSLLLILLFFSVTLKEFLFSDDLQNYQLFNSMLTGKPSASLWNAFMFDNELWMQQGRFTPLSFLWQDGVFMYIPTVKLYRLFVLVMNLLSITVVVVFIKKLPVKINFALWIICLCAVMQFRIQYHDAYTSLHGMYQLLTILIFGSLISYIKFNQTNRWGYWVLAVCMYTITLLVSEVGLGTVLFIPATALLFNNSIRKTLTHTMPFAVVTIAYLMIVMWLRTHPPAGGKIYYGLQSNLNFSDMYSLFERQMFATLPLSNLFNQIAIPQVLHHRFDSSPLITISILTLSITLFVLVVKRFQVPDGNSTFSPKLVLYFLLLSAVPAIFILPSVKYQKEIQMGASYLPVFIQNFGMALLLAYMAQVNMQSSKAIGKAIGYTITLFLVLCVPVTFLFNSALINAGICEKSAPSLAQYYSLKEGILNDVPDNSLIIVTQGWKQAWMYDEIFLNLTHKDFRVVDNSDYNISPADSVYKHCYLLETKLTKPISSKLYKLDCTTGAWGNVVAYREHENNLYQTDLEKNILHRILKPFDSN